MYTSRTFDGTCPERKSPSESFEISIFCAHVEAEGLHLASLISHDRFILRRDRLISRCAWSAL